MSVPDEIEAKIFRDCYGPLDASTSHDPWAVVNVRVYLKRSCQRFDHLRSQTQLVLDQSCRIIPNLLLPMLQPLNQPTGAPKATESLSWAAGSLPSLAPVQEESTTSLAPETFLMISRLVFEKIPLFVYPQAY